MGEAACESRLGRQILRVGEPSVREQRGSEETRGENVRTAESKGGFYGEERRRRGERRNVDAATVWYYGAAKEEKRVEKRGDDFVPRISFRKRAAENGDANTPR